MAARPVPTRPWGHRTTGRDRTQYFCKWQGLPYNQCTWEDADTIRGKFQAEIDDYMARRDSRHVPALVFRRVNSGDFVKLPSQPDWVHGGEVRGARPGPVVAAPRADSRPLGLPGCPISRAFVVRSCATTNWWP